MLYHIYTAYQPTDPETIRRNSVAQQTWKRQPWKELAIGDHQLPRMFEEGSKRFPYIRDLFDVGAEHLKDDDILVYTNADIMVRGDCSSKIVEALHDSYACYCYRRDFHHRVLTPIADHEFVKGMDYAGSDLKAFRVEWWRAYRNDMPDMLVGNEAYDPVLRQLIDETNPDTNNQLRDVICHERHASYWEDPKNRYTRKSQLHNLGLAKMFFLSRGINPGKFGIP